MALQDNSQITEQNIKDWLIRAEAVGFVRRLGKNADSEDVYRFTPHFQRLAKRIRWQRRLLSKGGAR